MFCNMLSYNWRVMARIIAYADMVNSILALVSAFAIAIKDAGVESTDAYVLILHPWPVFTIFAMLLFVNIWATMRIIKGTGQSAEPKGARNCACFWRNVNIGFLVFLIFSNLISVEWLPLSVLIGCHEFYIILVSIYIKELETAAFISEL